MRTCAKLEKKEHHQYGKTNALEKWNYEGLIDFLW